jgi:lysozyme family protein
MKQNYNYALQQVLKSEGGYTNDPRDPGGPTNYGITIADYRAYINKAGTAQDVKNMHLADAQSIYRSKYWNAVNGDNLPSGVDYTVFDYGVNSGVSRANRVYNQLKAKYPKTGDLINAINDERLAFLKSLRTWSAFGAGWGSRVARVRADSLKLAQGGNTASTGSAGAVVVAGAGAATQVPHHYLPWIIGGTVVLAIITWLAIDIYKFRKVTTNA